MYSKLGSDCRLFSIEASEEFSIYCSIYDINNNVLILLVYSYFNNIMFQVPATSDEWKNIEYGFRTRWNFPGCVEALDGKHVVIRAPPGSGSDYFNYKNRYSIVLMALVDSVYCFLYVDVGVKERGSDGGIFQNSSLYNALETNSLSIPNNFVILADDAFPLKKYIMKQSTQFNPCRKDLQLSIVKSKTCSGKCLWHTRE